jgi:hypothetical protein
MLDWNTIHILAAKEASLAEGGRTATPRPSPSRTERSFAAPALGLLALLVVGIWTALALRKEAAVRALPASTRAQILQHGLAELRTICREPGAAQGPLRERCVEQAKFVLALPECGPQCRAVAIPVLPRARR